MAVYHLECRMKAEPNRPNPPARVAKWQQACALPSCQRMIWKGDTISCTRDNENGHRKGPSSATIPAPVAELAREEQAPATHRDPFPILAATAPNEAEWVPRASLDCARRLLADEQKAHERTTRDLAAALAKVEDFRNVIEVVSKVVKGAL